MAGLSDAKAFLRTTGGVYTIVTLREEADAIVRQAPGKRFPLTYAATNKQAAGKNCGAGRMFLLRVKQDTKTKTPGGYVYAIVEVVERYFDNDRALRENSAFISEDFAIRKMRVHLRGTDTVTLVLKPLAILLTADCELPQIPTRTLCGTAVRAPITDEVRAAACEDTKRNRRCARRALADI